MAEIKNKGLASDEELVKLYWQRDMRAVSETDIKYGKLLHGIAFGILHDNGEGEECLNDTYLALWNAIPPTRPKVFRAFAARIMRRIAINRYNEKTAKRRAPSEYTGSLEELAEVFSADDTVESAYAEIELGKLINEFLAGLSQRERFVFIGRFYMAESLESIAASLSVNSSTVHRELGKIKGKLKDFLERNGVDI